MQSHWHQKPNEVIFPIFLHLKQIFRGLLSLHIADEALWFASLAKAAGWVSGRILQRNRQMITYVVAQNSTNIS